MNLKEIISGDFKSTVLFLCLILPLGVPAFFHPGSSHEFRIIMSTFDLLFITVFAFCYLKKEAVFYLPRTDMVLITAWAVWACASVVFSDHVVASTLRQWEWFCKILFSFCLWAYLKERQDRLVPIHWMIIIGVLLICSSFGLYWYLLYDPSHYNWGTGAPHFTHIRNFGHYIAAGISLSIFPVLSDHKECNIARVIMTFLLLTILWGFLFWSGSRGSLAATVIGCLFACGFLTKNKKLFFTLLIFSIIVGFAASSFFPVEDARFGLENAVKRTGESFLTGRQKIWTDALQDVNGSLLFGLGPDSFRFYSGLKHLIIQPHNALIQGLLEWGIPGTVLLILLHFQFMHHGFVKLTDPREVRFHPIKSTALSFIVVYFFLGLVDGVYYHAIPLTLLAYAFAVIALPGTQNVTIVESNPHIPVTRLPIRVLTILLVAVFCLQFAVSKICQTKNVPDPFSTKGRLIRFFPSDTRGLDRWVMVWKEHDPEVALQASIKFALATSSNYAFWRVASIISAEQGDFQMARQMAENAIQNSRGDTQDYLIEEFKLLGIKRDI